MTPGLLFIGHGTQLESGERATREFAYRIYESLIAIGSPAFEMHWGLAFLEFLHPTIDEAIRQLYLLGVKHLIIVPLFLLAAGHVQTDIPAAVKRAILVYPDLSTHILDPPGAHPLFSCIHRDRLLLYLEESETDACAVVFVGRGSQIPSAYRTWVTLTNQILYDCELPRTYAYLAGFGTNVLRALERCQHGGIRRIVVISHLLFPGKLMNQVVNESHAWAKKTGIEVTCQPPISEHSLAVHAFTQIVTGRI